MTPIRTRFSYPLKVFSSGRKSVRNTETGIAGAVLRDMFGGNR